MKIEEVIVVEGRDDTARVKEAVDCETIETHGYGISAATWKTLEKAYETKGLIILTDPDHAGGGIRKRLIEKFPESIEAFIPRRKAELNGDIGVENTSPEDIREALKKALERAGKKAGSEEPEDKPLITANDMTLCGLDGGPGSRAMREKVAEILGIGYGNAKAMLRRMNALGVSPGELDEAVRTIRDKEDKE